MILAESGYYIDSWQGGKLSDAGYSQLKDHYLLMAAEYYLTGEEHLRLFEDNDGLKGWLYLTDPLGEVMMEYVERSYIEAIPRVVKLPYDVRECLDPLWFHRSLTWEQYAKVMKSKFNRARLIQERYYRSHFEVAWKLIPPYTPSHLDNPILADVACRMYEIFLYGCEGRTELLKLPDLDQVLMAKISKAATDSLHNSLEMNRLVLGFYKAYTSGLEQWARMTFGTIRKNDKLNKNPTDYLSRLLRDAIINSDKMMGIIDLMEKHDRHFQEQTDCACYFDP